MTINSIQFATASVFPEVQPGQHVCGVLTIDLSIYMLTNGFSTFIGNPSVIAQIQQDDTAINTGYPCNIVSSVISNSNQIKLVIIYYNTKPVAVNISTFQTLINLSIEISGQVGLLI